MKKVLVIGSGGAGKSVFAKRLGALLQLEVLHLDKFYWRPGWVETPKTEWLQIVETLLRAEAWIMDGNYSGTLDLRLDSCDTVIFLDMPRLLCLRRVLRRAISYRDTQRPDMSEGCPERVSLEFISWVWNYSRRTRPKVMARLEKISTSKRVVRLRSDDEVETFLTRAKAEAGN